MPELPEVEVTRLGVSPHVVGQQISQVILRHSGLRWPFPDNLAALLCGKIVRSTSRRGKYLLLNFDHGSLIIHLGMSGHLRVVPADTPPQKHDHIDVVFGDQAVRMTDPRRFGAVLWHDAQDGHVNEHLLLRYLGVEPLESAFTAALLFKRTRLKKAPIKQVLLSGDIVVGVGNIYACEALFQAGINPKTAAGRISLARYEKLTLAIRKILAEAITKGGSTLRDFIGVDGSSGYFQQSYFVYGRTDAPCRVCGTPIKQIKQGQRSTFYCPNCQR
jgi:formamidopyrimidine-DNA glycosylase